MFVARPARAGAAPIALDASPQLQDLLSELRFREVHNIQTDHDRRCSAQPATRRRARDSEVRGDGHVPGAVDEISKAVVVALLRAGRSRHGNDHRRFLTPLNSLRTMRARPSRRNDNSRGRVQNVRRDSSELNHRISTADPYRSLADGVRDREQASAPRADETSPSVSWPSEKSPSRVWS